MNSDLAPSILLLPGMFFTIALLALAIAFLGPKHDRGKRSLALLIVLVATLGIMSQLLHQPLGPALSLGIFLGIFFVFHLMGKFDSPEK